MAIVQGSKTIEVNVLLKSAEVSLVSDAQNKAIRELGNEGKRVTHIEKSKRVAGFGELGGYYVIIDLLWEADTEDVRYKEAERRAVQLAREEREKKEREEARKAEEARRLELEAAKVVAENRAVGTKRFWDKHEAESEALRKERTKLLQVYTEASNKSNKKGADIIKKRAENIKEILSKLRTPNEKFSLAERIEMEARGLAELSITDRKAYDQYEKEHPILVKYEDFLETYISEEGRKKEKEDKERLSFWKGSSAFPVIFPMIIFYCIGYKLESHTIATIICIAVLLLVLDFRFVAWPVLKKNKERKRRLKELETAVHEFARQNASTTTTK